MWFDIPKLQINFVLNNIYPNTGNFLPFQDIKSNIK